MSGISSPNRVETLADAGGHTVACLQIAESLPEYFNEAGLAQIRSSLSKDVLHVATRNGCIVGFATTRESGDETAEIAWLAVDPTWQRLGIGRDLMKRIEEYLTRKGVKLLTVKTLAEEADYPPFEATRRFYNKNGFTKVATINSYPGWDGDPATIYEKIVIQARKEVRPGG